MPEADRPSSAASDEDAWARRTSAAIAAGSREALASLYLRRFDLLFRTARERTRRDESFALDCVQDAMLRIVHRMPILENAAALDAWLRRTVLSAAVDRVRAEVSRRRREEGVVRAEARVPATDDSEALLERLRSELASLDSDARTLLDLRFRRGLSLRATGDATGLATKAVDSRLRRIVLHLRAAITPHEPEKRPAPTEDGT